MNANQPGALRGASLKEKTMTPEERLEQEVRLAEMEVSRLRDALLGELRNVEDACETARRRVEGGGTANELGPLQGCVAHANAAAGGLAVAMRVLERLLSLRE